MTDEQRKERAVQLRDMVESTGGRILLEHIDQESKSGWLKFIDMPVDKKTSKAAYDAQARYKVLEDLKDWIESEIKIGE